MIVLNHNSEMVDAVTHVLYTTDDKSSYYVRSLLIVSIHNPSTQFCYFELLVPHDYGYMKQTSLDTIMFQKECIRCNCFSNRSLNCNTLRPRQNGRHYPDDIFKCIFLNQNCCILMKISLKFVPHGPINNIPALVQIMALRRSGDKLLPDKWCSV